MKFRRVIHLFITFGQTTSTISTLTYQNLLFKDENQTYHTDFTGSKLHHVSSRQKVCKANNRTKIFQSIPNLERPSKEQPKLTYVKFT